MFYRFYSQRKTKEQSRAMAAALTQQMIYSQAIHDQQFSPAVALFGAAGLIRTTASITGVDSAAASTAAVAAKAQEAHQEALRKISRHSKSWSFFG
ncbi:hypothetical protein DdX_14877 [Ditylenchus destructor]|uniref:Uncharacterized protein n=1 Tax=Ditylenchus destructor TaxID=166010 RepID=A0AAD4MRC0_9BILA|nr:hypothetical protein DdX_14877 [Ditylenchus destructor]